ACVVTSASSDIPRAKLAKGAPADVFASADDEAMTRAQRDRVVRAQTRRDFASNRLALIVPASAPTISSLDQLATPNVRRIAVGSPQIVPAGRYAKQALEAANI